MSSVDGAAAGSPRVLVTGAGGPAAVAVLARLAETTRAVLHAVDIDPLAAGLYLVPAERRWLVPRGDDPGFVDAVLALCVASGIDVLVPTVDTELLPVAEADGRFAAAGGRLPVAEAAGRFAAAGVRLLLAPAAALRLCLDKWALVRACRGLVPVPRTALVDAAFDPAAFDPAAWDGAPALVKPRSGSGSRGIRVLRTLAEITALPRTGELIVQEYLPGEEYSLDVLAATTGEVLAVVPRVRLKVDSGVCVTARTLHDPELATFGRRVSEAAGLTGVSNVQCRRDLHGCARLLEVNARFPGTMPLTVASGVDMPTLALWDTLGRRTGPAPTGNGPVAPLAAFTDLAMVRTWQEHYLSPAELAVRAPVRP